MVSVIFPLHFSLMGLHIILTIYYQNLICIIIHHCKVQYMSNSILILMGGGFMVPILMNVIIFILVTWRSQLVYKTIVHFIQILQNYHLFNV